MIPNKPTLPQVLTFILCLIGFVVIIVWLFRSNPVKKDTTILTQDSIYKTKYEKQYKDLLLISDSLKTLKSEKNKVQLIIKKVPVYIDSLTFAETIKSAIKVFDSVVLIPREKDTLTGFTVIQVKQAIKTDTLYKLCLKENNINDSIIRTQNNYSLHQDTIIMTASSQVQLWKTGYDEMAKSYSKAHKWQGIFGKGLIVSGVLNVLQFILK